MAVKPITKATVLRRREQVAELYIRGQTQCEIAEALGVSQPTVSLDLKAIQQSWRESAIYDYNFAVGRELLKLEHLEREAWKGWERSQKPSQTAVVHGDGNGAAGGNTTKTMHSRDGDPRFLEIAHKCSAARRALLGLDAAPVIREGDGDVDLSIEARRARIMGVLAPNGQRCRAGPNGAGPAAGQPGDLRTIDEPGQMAAGQAPRLPGPGDP